MLGLGLGLGLGAGLAGYAPPAIARNFGGVTASKDGSTGQTYTAPATMTGIQWYREVLTIDRTKTLIGGATASTYIAQAADEGYRLVARGMVDAVEQDAVAIHVVLPVPILLDGFTSTAGWTATAGAALSIVTDDPVEGTTRMLMRGTGTASAKAVKTTMITADATATGIWAFHIDLNPDPEIQSVQNARVAPVVGGTEYYLANVTTINGATYQTPSTLWLDGTWSSFNISEVATIPAGSATIGAALTHSGQSPNIAPLKYDALMYRSGGRPTVVINFDDIYQSLFDVGFPIMEARGIKSSLAVAQDYIGAGSPRMTQANIQTMYDAGHDIIANGTKGDGPMTSMASVAAALAELADQEAYFLSLGWTRGRGQLVYPNGSYQIPGTKILPAGNVTSTGTAVVTMGSTTGILAGMEVRGENVPAGTTVVSNDSATQVTLSQNVPAQAKPMSFTNTSGAFHTMKLPKALQAAGYKSARTTLASGSIHTRYGVSGRGMVMFGNSMHALSAAAFNTAIQLMKTRGGTYRTYTHGVQTGGGINIDPTIFTANMDLLAAERDAGNIDILTESQWWARDGGSSVPI